MTCPTEDEALAFEDLQATVEASAEIQDHLKGCEPCQRRRERLKTLFEDLASAPAQTLSRDLFRSSVLARIATDNPRRRASALALAAAIALALLVPAVLFFASTNWRDQESFANRGGLVEGALRKRAGVDPFVVRGDTMTPLDANTGIVAGDALTFRQTNIGDEPVYFLAFAIDARQEVHWLWPAHNDVRRDPSAPEIRAGARDELLPEAVEPENVAAGLLRIVAVISRKRLTVRDVERRLLDHLELGRPISDLFSADDLVVEWRTRVVEVK